MSIESINFLNGQKQISYARIASKIGVSKPALRKYMAGDLTGTDKAVVTKKLNKLVKEYK